MMRTIPRFFVVYGLIISVVLLAGCASEPAKPSKTTVKQENGQEQTGTKKEANKKPINYGCSGMSALDCMTMRTPLDK